MCGSADDLSWLPPGTTTTELSTTTSNGSAIDNEGINEGKVGFIIRYAADLQSIIEVVHFADGAVDEIRYVKATTAPNASTTGDLFISGKRGKTTTGSKDGGFYIAKLNNNFINGTPTGIVHVFNIPTHGKEDEHAEIQPWDVTTDGKVISIRYGQYNSTWGEIVVFPATPATPANPEDNYEGVVYMPGFRSQTLDDGSTHYGTAQDIPAGRTGTASRMILKTQQTNASGLQRSFTFDDYHRWEKDENGYWRKGKYPLDVMWNNYWRYPETVGTAGEINNMWGGDTRGYIGYKLAGTGGTEGAPYTPRVGAINVDKRNNHIYLGLNWQSRLPDSNNPDFEPALIALDNEGYMKWWCRLYKEYNDNGSTAPQAHNASVSTVNSTTQIVASSLAGTTIDISRITSGSNGFVNGYRRLYWKTGANAPGFSEISGYDEATGTITLLNTPANAVQGGDTFMIDATVMTKTQTSTPDQYIDAIAIDYSHPLDGSNNDAYIYVAARAHGNNVTNFWKGNEITSNPAASTYHNQFTGGNGNAHYTWVGKLRDDATKATLLAATWVSEYGEEGDFADYSGMGDAYTDPLMDFWPNHNSGWPDINTTTLRHTMWVNGLGQLCLIAKAGRSTLTTSNAYQRNIRPVIKGTISAVSSTSTFTVGDIAGANLILSSNTKFRITSTGGNKNTVHYIDSFDNETGQITLTTPLAELPAIGNKIQIDEGTGAWNSFVRVFESDLSQPIYSSLLTSAINPVDATGAGNNTELHGVWPINDGVIVVGKHNDSDSNGTTDGNAVPLTAVPSWGTSTPTGEMALLARLSFTPAGSTSPSTYADWAASYDWQGETQTAATNDPDGDGQSNFTEYALNASPINATPQNLPVLVKSGSNHLYRVTLGRDSTEVTYTVEFSADLSDWSSITPQTLSGSAGSTFDVTLDLSSGKRFARLKMTQ